MSDDLVKRWDDYVESMGCVMGEVEHTAQQMRDRIKELETKLAKAVEALELALELADSGLVDFSRHGLSCDADINKHYRTTLAALKGQDDE